MTNVLMPAKWVDNYGNALYAFVLKRVANTVLAEDIVQDVFLSAWRSKETFNGSSTEKNWLYSICKNKIIDYYRKSASNKEVLNGDEGDEDYFFVDDGHWAPAVKPTSWNITYDTTFYQKEFYSILNLCKKKLKKIQEMVFTMKYLEDIDTEEICNLLNITPQNYWILIHRAKIQLRTCLEKNWVQA